MFLIKITLVSYLYTDTVIYCLSYVCRCVAVGIKGCLKLLPEIKDTNWVNKNANCLRIRVRIRHDLMFFTTEGVKMWNLAPIADFTLWTEWTYQTWTSLRNVRCLLLLSVSKKQLITCPSPVAKECNTVSHWISLSSHNCASGQSRLTVWETVISLEHCHILTSCADIQRSTPTLLVPIRPLPMKVKLYQTVHLST